MENFVRKSFAFLVCTVLLPSAALAAKGDNPADNNMPAGARMMAAPMSTTGTSNHGHFVCTAAINANGTVFSGEYVNASQTLHLGTGTYQVGFNTPCADVRIAGGWFRIAQPDTLTYGTLPSETCTVADRYGVPSAIWIQCYNSTGALVDTSFTLHVSR
jgi:hypothetical protein